MKISILGAGSFGTALAIAMSPNAKEIALWSHSSDVAQDIADKRENPVYLPGIQLPDNIHASHEMQGVLKDSEIVVSVIPTQATRGVWEKAREFLPASAKIVVASKGIECESHLLLSDVLLSLLEPSFKNSLYFLSGPSFAKEIALKRPTAITLAGTDSEGISQLQSLLGTDFLRIYGTTDIIGVQLGGALKNVIALAVGISDGLEMGNNSRAALITRGLAEIARLGKVMGADPMTLMGLAGLGDLVLTCTGDLSRNRSVGIKIGQGMNLDDIQSNTRMIAEGVTTTRSVYEISNIKNVQMPITQGVFEILYNKKQPLDVISMLMSRQVKFENE